LKRAFPVTFLLRQAASGANLTAFQPSLSFCISGRFEEARIRMADASAFLITEET
jgi:hypothetical protein